MKDLAVLAAKYDTRNKIRCLVCNLGAERVAILRQLRQVHGLSIRGLGKVIEGEFGRSIADTTIFKHFSRHEAA